MINEVSHSGVMQDVLEHPLYYEELTHENSYGTKNNQHITVCYFMYLHPVRDASLGRRYEINHPKPHPVRDASLGRREFAEKEKNPKNQP